MRIEFIPRRALTPARYLEAVRLCERAYDEDDDVAELMVEFDDATHVLLIDDRDRLVSHALWVDRWLMHSSGRVHSAYVELVATDPELQRQGYGSAVMRAVGDAITAFDIGALSPSDPAFYARFGWQCWRGPLLEQRADGSIVPSLADEVVMILPVPGGPQLDLTGSLTARWRRGEIW